MSLHRMTIFFSQVNNNVVACKKDIVLKIKNMLKEINSLEEYVGFLSQRNSFLLDATLGIICVEQNLIIKVFTMAAAIFMPPTLIASIYGMNFHNMPELCFKHGYLMALMLMFFSAILPYIYFKHKGWL